MQPRTQVLLGLAFTAGAAAIARAASRQRHAVSRPGKGGDPASTVAAASGVGIMPIDPESITQIAGEGIDLDAQVSRPAPLDEVVGRGGYR
jgi:hypothetical protein